MRLKKIILEQFGKWSTMDFVLTLLAILVVIPVSVVLNKPALFMIVGVLIVPCAILASKKTALGYCALSVALLLYSFVLYRLDMMGSLILAGLIIPLFIYKTVKLYVKKLNISTRIGYIEMICLGLLLALSCYPIYLLMKILDVGFPIVETVCLIFGVLAVFLEVRNCKLANFIYPILLILQFVIYVLFIIELRSSVIPVSIGILLALLSQITILIRFLKDKFLIKRRSWSKTNS